MLWKRIRYRKPYPNRGHPERHVIAKTELNLLECISFWFVCNDDLRDARRTRDNIQSKDIKMVTN